MPAKRRLGLNEAAEHLDVSTRTSRRYIAAAYVADVLAAAPPLTDQQRTALAELLRPARRNGAA